MRGAPSEQVTTFDASRIIPADAGSTKPSRETTTSQKDHPRGCGEHAVALIGIVTRRGSSPRMRGAPHIAPCKRQKLRIIPADAGSTRSVRVEAQASADHPRGCGEHEDRRASRPAARGSSPRMRGARALFDGRTCQVGIIPADAGSTCCRASDRFAAGDHPRGCGEHDMVTTITEDNAGSSPRMRGAPHLYDETSNHSGIIPADAGSTPLLFCSSLITQDHPRGCGEHLRAYDVARVRPGSSPRMRGAL